MKTPSVDTVIDSAANAWDLLIGGGVADLSRTPSSVVDEGPQRTVRCYRTPSRPRPLRHAPVLLVPPLAAPASCFDLRRGCSLAEHLLARGYPTYLVDYGAISFNDRDLGLEHWVDEVIPKAIEVAARDGGQPVQVVGWCLGGIMAMLAIAGDQKLPVSSVSLIASPFDFEKVRLMAPLRRLADLTGGALGTALYRALGGAPARLVSLGFRATAIDRYLTKPAWILQHLDDRELLAQMEAVDDYMANMLAYPGRTFGQLYHRFFRVNELASGRMRLGDDGRVIDLADVRQPVLAVAGESDILAPEPAVLALADLLPNAAEVRLETAPGGHLGVLTGRAAIETTWDHLDEFLAKHDTVKTTKTPEKVAA